MTVDILMTVMPPLQMAYSLIGETYHEAEGVILLALFIAHHAMRRNWRRRLPIWSGKNLILTQRGS